ncbi:hypothetical protein [Sphingopyxis sp. HXXIV]|nr:hypothetical protein [Sphingopyxis sp. HXXIV]KTE31831.1 hypothetical protein ATE62_18925 [Sphingopyxis sp. HIX]KTE83222.1 hypothetical protein ATE72_15080 [Sphingopyxis sp. HXXIV]
MLNVARIIVAIGLAAYLIAKYAFDAAGLDAYRDTLWVAIIAVILLDWISVRRRKEASHG